MATKRKGRYHGLSVKERGENPHLVTLKGRPFKPYILSLILTMIVVAQSNVRNMDRGTEYPLSIAVAFLAGASAAAILWGWLGNRHWWLMVGLGLSVFAWATRAAFIQMTNSLDQSIFFSLAGALAAGGAFYMEAQAWKFERSGGIGE